MSALGIAIVGLGGAVASTAVAGVELMKAGKIGKTGLPLADEPGLVPVEDIAFGGWDLYPDTLDKAARHHRVLDRDQMADAEASLSTIAPWPAVGNARFCEAVTGTHQVETSGHRETVACLQGNLARFREEIGGPVVLINLASVERTPDKTRACFKDLAAFEKALDEGDEEISPGMLYAYAAIDLGIPVGNFTPGYSVDVPALIAFAEERGVPLAGKDGKTGQTYIKTVLAPAFRDRALKIDGWYSTNILGNRDGEALNEPKSLQSKIDTKGDVLNSIVGYEVGDHLVQINYYRPRGDEKEAWDNIDVRGFLDQPMQIKVNFLCKDSILAAPLVIDIARCLELAQRRGTGGPVEELGAFFKAPVTRDGRTPLHAFPEQMAVLREWLDAARREIGAATAAE